MTVGRVTPGADGCTPNNLRRRRSTRKAVAALLADAGNDPWSGFPLGYSYIELARIVYEVAEPTPAALVAVRRAVSALVADGRAKRVRRRGGEVEVLRAMTEADHRTRDLTFERPRRERERARREAIPYPVDTGYGGVEEVEVEPVLRITEDLEVELREPGEVRS